MDNFIKQIIDEAFASKKQQKYFYARANDPTLSPKERRKWKKWAKEYSEKTNFKKLKEKAEPTEEEVDEIVDEKGNIKKNKKPDDFVTKNTTSKSTNDEVVHTGMGQMGSWGVMGGGISRNPIKFWTESDMSKALGYEDTLGKDEPYDEAKEHFEDELGLNDDEAEDRLKQMGYDEELPDGKIRIIENPQKFIEEYVESLLAKRTKENDVLEKETNTELNPIIKKQIETLKETLKNNGISMETFLKYLKNNE